MPRSASRSALLRSALGALLCGATIGLSAASALAAEGGSSSCPWQQDVSLVLDTKTLTIPPAVFETKSGPAPVIDGYELLPNVNALVLRIQGPRGELWEAALTRVGAKRCTGFYVGKPVLIAEPPPFVPRSSKSSVAVR